MTLIRQDGKAMPLDPPEPESLDTKARAAATQEEERATGLALLLASFDGYAQLWKEPEHIRQHFAQWALIALRGSSFGAGQFHYQPLALHAAAQAAATCEAHQEQFEAPDLCSNSDEQRHWYLVMQRGLTAYHECLGGKTTDTAQRLFGTRMEVLHDPRRI
jgi:hypothetical protein